MQNGKIVRGRRRGRGLRGEEEQGQFEDKNKEEEEIKNDKIVK